MRSLSPVRLNKEIILNGIALLSCNPDRVQDPIDNDLLRYFLSQSNFKVLALLLVWTISEDEQIMVLKRSCMDGSADGCPHQICIDMLAPHATWATRLSRAKAL